MVLFFTSTAVSPPATIYMGKDKVSSTRDRDRDAVSLTRSMQYENEELLRYGRENDVWFHVDKVCFSCLLFAGQRVAHSHSLASLTLYAGVQLSSAHVYLRLPAGLGVGWEAIPAALLDDCAQLVKANSIEGHKKTSLTVIYTPWSNVKKTGDMPIGAVAFHNERNVKRIHVPHRNTDTLTRLNKTRSERAVDHEAERQQHLRAQGRLKKARAIQDRKDAQAHANARRLEAEARDYSTRKLPPSLPPN